MGKTALGSFILWGRECWLSPWEQSQCSICEPSMVHRIGNKLGLFLILVPHAASTGLRVKSSGSVGREINHITPRMLPSPLQLGPMALGSNRFLLSQSKFVSQDSFQSPGKQVWRTRSERQWKGDWNSGLQVGWRGCTARVGVLVLLKGVCRARLLAAQKTTNRPGWRKGKFALFQILATVGGG